LEKLANDGQWIFAYLYKGEYYAEDIISLDSLYSLEYIDTKNNEYQLWHWPSGEIYKIEPDREVESKDIYALPNNKTGTTWLPRFTIINTDKEKVDLSFRKISSLKKGKSTKLVH
jgi:hypothetical protein